jgi:hypothetical protein
LTETVEFDDFITTISPGVDWKFEAPTGFIDLDYELRRHIYNDFSEFDFTGHRGRLEARKDFSPRFSAGIRNLFIRSQDPLELTGVPTFERPSIRTGRSPYTRNILEPDATFRFGENRSIRLAYLNQILRNERENIADIDENNINGLLTYRFNIHNDVEAQYNHIRVDYDPTIPPEPPRDFDGGLMRGRYNYYFNPITSAFFQYRYYQKDFDQETTFFFDYKVHEPTLGFSHDLYENVTLSAFAGYAYRNTDIRRDEDTFAGRLSLSGRYKRLNTEIYGETGFQDDFRTAESLGFNKFQRAGIEAGYQLFERLNVSGLFFTEENKFVDLDRIDKFRFVRGRLIGQILKWVFISFDYEYNRRDSNRAFQSYTNNRFFARITFQYDVAEKYQ